MTPRRAVRATLLFLLVILVVLILLPRSRAADRPAVGTFLAEAPAVGHHGFSASATWYDQTGTVGACGTVLGNGHQHAYWYAASKTLPCGTKLTVHYDGRQHFAVVQDYGPRYADIDLSRRVFRELAPLGAGRIRVWVTRRSR